MIPPEHFESFKAGLLSGQYNLLFGSGVSLDSTNGLNEKIRSAETLRKDLCLLKNVRDNTSLNRVAAMLSPDEREQQLVRRFAGCKPAPSLSALPRFLWRRLFTFNIDDLIENLYSEHASSKQALIPLNYLAPLEPTPTRSELHAIHLHGWVKNPEDGFVFSFAEYAKSVSGLNPWMHLLSEILATESFIIAGTSLNEVDLEYYLSHRRESAPRKSRGPSLLIEPFPDAATESDRTRHGLLLVKATFADFLAWLHAQFPSPPTLSDLLVPNIDNLFTDHTIRPRLVRFFSDFKLISAGVQAKSQVPSAFLYGRAPTKDDLDQHLDISRADNQAIQSLVESAIKKSDGEALVAIIDDPGTGKTTILQRVAHDLTMAGIPVLAVSTLSRIDTENAIMCISALPTKSVLIVDNLADHSEQIYDILSDSTAQQKILVLASERNYRKPLVDLVLGELKQRFVELHPLNSSERLQLIELYRQYGFIGDHNAIRDPGRFATRLKNDPVAIAVCRILNDFRPLQDIVDSLWEATQREHRLPYLAVALSQHCHVAGLRESVLQGIVGPKQSLASLFTRDVPLSLTYNTDDDYYLLPTSSVIGERILNRSVKSDRQVLFQAFCNLSHGLAHHVNRRAIMLRSPEARLAQRLFDGDKIVKPMLGNEAENFYIQAQPQWEWNSRYWEQRALLVADTDLTTALQYARHAVAIELHPFPLTTLGKILLRHLDLATSDRDSIFSEAFDRLSTAIGMEGRRSRIRVHPFATVFAGAAKYLELGGTLNATQAEKIALFVQDAETNFRLDPTLKSSLMRLRAVSKF